MITLVLKITSHDILILRQCRLFMYLNTLISVFFTGRIKVSVFIVII